MARIPASCCLLTVSLLVAGCGKRESAQSTAPVTDRPTPPANAPTSIAKIEWNDELVAAAVKRSLRLPPYVVLSRVKATVVDANHPEYAIKGTAEFRLTVATYRPAGDLFYKNHAFAQVQRVKREDELVPVDFNVRFVASSASSAVIQLPIIDWNLWGKPLGEFKRPLDADSLKAAEARRLKTEAEEAETKIDRLSQRLGYAERLIALTAPDTMDTPGNDWWAVVTACAYNLGFSDEAKQLDQLNGKFFPGVGKKADRVAAVSRYLEPSTLPEARRLIETVATLRTKVRNADRFFTEE